MQKAKNPKQEDDWNWNSDHPKQYAFTHWSSPIFNRKTCDKNKSSMGVGYSHPHSGNVELAR